MCLYICVYHIFIDIYEIDTHIHTHTHGSYLRLHHLRFQSTPPLKIDQRSPAKRAPCKSSTSSAPLRSARRAVPCVVVTWHRREAWDLMGRSRPIIMFLEPIAECGFGQQEWGSMGVHEIYN